jgi:hypothetical protein
MVKTVATGFVIAIAITVLSVLLFVALQPHVSFGWAFAPGLVIQPLFELAGVRANNRLAINSTFLFWWIVSVIALLLLRFRRMD